MKALLKIEEIECPHCKQLNEALVLAKGATEADTQLKGADSIDCDNCSKKIFIKVEATVQVY